MDDHRCPSMYSLQPDKYELRGIKRRQQQLTDTTYAASATLPSNPYSQDFHFIQQRKVESLSSKNEGLSELTVECDEIAEGFSYCRDLCAYRGMLMVFHREAGRVWS